jgi:signal transduction histidine kinase
VTLWIVADEFDTQRGRKWLQTFRAPHLDTGGEEEPLSALRLAASIGILFLILYLFVDVAIRRAAPWMHLLAIAAAAVFLALTWTPMFRRFWQLWVFAVCLVIMVMFIAISAVTRDPVSRLSVIILCPFATASFVSWSPRWQLAMSAAALLAYSAAQFLVPINDNLNIYRWLSVLAALLLAQSTSIFIDQYRLKIRGQLEELEAAARFRERQIATMAHDIRNPVSALAGYVELLEEPSTSPADREQMIARIGSTAWNTNLVVGNSLDLYRMEEDGCFQVKATDTDPNPVLAEIVEDCAAQARRVGTRFLHHLESLPHVSVDPQHLARIVRNLAAVPLGAECNSEVSLRTSVCGERIALEIDAPGAKITPADLEQMMTNPRGSARPLNAGRIGLFLARSMIEAAGGSLLVRSLNPIGIHLRAEFPCAHPGR